MINLNGLNSRKLAAVWLGLSLVLVNSNTFAQTVTPTADDVQANEVFQSSRSAEAGTGGGGPWVSEEESIWSRGEITSVEICYGKYVENLTFFYGGVRGTRFGPPNVPVGCEVWPVPKAGGYLKSIEVWSGIYMDAIQFKMSDDTTSKRFGGDGGGRTVIEDPNNGAIRMVDGKSGRYVDRLRVHFGLPYYINNIKPDYTALDEQLDAAEPKQIDVQEVDACRSSSPISNTISVKETIVESHSFNFSNTTAIGLETSIEGQFGGFIKVGSKFSVNTAFTVGSAKNFTSSTEHTASVQATANAGELKKVITVSKEAKLNLPFTYDLVHYKNGDKNNIVNTKQFNGVYQGVKTSASDTKAVDYSCETNQPIVSSGGGGDSTSTQPQSPAVTDSSSTDDESGNDYSEGESVDIYE